MDKITTPTSITDIKPQKLYSAISNQRAKKLGQELSNFLKSNNLLIEIAGKNYVPVEGWQFVGMQLGLTEVVTECNPVAPFEDSTEIKYKAVVEVINQHGTVISRGFAWCSNKESKKKGFEEYAIASMAQTRAVGKAYRNILAWIVKMAGYESTPAEEINSEKMEADLNKAKQNVVKEFEQQGITSSKEIMDYIRETLDKASIDNIDEANKIISKLKGNLNDEGAS